MARLGLNIQEGLSLRHAVKHFDTYDLMDGTDATSSRGPLDSMGYEVNLRDLNSGLHAIQINTDGLPGAADPRRKGITLVGGCKLLQLSREQGRMTHGSGN